MTVLIENNQPTILDQTDTILILNEATVGPQGPPGPGIPTGGTAAQILAKNSNTNYDTAWITPILPNAAPLTGQIPIGNGTAYAATNISGDATLAQNGALTVTKSNGTAFGTAAFQNTGTSGANIPLLNTANTWALQQTFSLAPIFSTMTPTGLLIASTSGLLAQDPNLNWDFSNHRLGIGTGSPQDQLELKGGQQFLTNSAVNTGFTAYVPTNVFGRFGIFNTSNGGLQISGYSSTNTSSGILIQGGVNGDPTTNFAEAFVFQGFGRSGTGGTTIGASGRVLAVYNYTTPLVTILGNGNVGIGVQGPAAPFHVQGSTGALLAQFRMPSDLGVALYTHNVQVNPVIIGTINACYFSAQQNSNGTGTTTNTLMFGFGRNLNGGTSVNDTYAPSTTINTAAATFQTTFAPSANAPNYAAVQINPTINGTSSGKATALAIASKTNTLTGGTINLLELGTTTTDYFSGFTSLLKVTSKGSLVLGNSALATNATDGFLYIPSCAGAPTGTPTTQTGTVPIIFDTTDHKLYFYEGGAWVGLLD